MQPVRTPQELREAARLRAGTASAGETLAAAPAVEPPKLNKHEAFLADLLPSLSPMRPLQSRLQQIEK